MVLEDGVHRLSLANEGAHCFVQQGEAILGNVYARSGLCKDCPVLAVCRSCTVIVFVQPTGGLFPATIADKRCLVSEWAVVIEGDKVRAMPVALGTMPTFPLTDGGIDFAQVLPVAVFCKRASIGLFVKSVMLLEDSVLLYLF